MAWTSQTLSGLITRITDDVVSRSEDTTARIRQSLPWTLARVMAGALYDLYGYAGYLAQQIIVTTATDEYLDEHGLTWGVERDPATTATGFVTVEGTSGQTLSGGAELSRADGVEFVTTADVLFGNTIEAVPVSAVDAGADGNCAGGTLLTLASPPSGFRAATYAITSDGMTGGTVATKADGYVIVYALSGSTLPLGAQLKRLDGTGYETETATTWADDGYRLIGARALSVGTGGNCDVGTYLEVQAPPAGVTVAASVAPDGVSGGGDEQGDAAFRAAILERIQSPPHGGAASDYVAWAKATPNVRVANAWAFGYPTVAAGTVDVYFTIDDTGAGTIPSAGEIAAVDAYIDPLRPVTADVTVDAPTPHSVDLTIALTVETGSVTATVRTAIQAKLEAAFGAHDLSSATSYFRNSEIHGAIASAEGVDYYTLTAVDGGAGTADVTLTAYELPTLGTITWS